MTVALICPPAAGLFGLIEADRRVGGPEEACGVLTTVGVGVLTTDGVTVTWDVGVSVATAYGDAWTGTLVALAASAAGCFAFGVAGGGDELPPQPASTAVASPEDTINR